MVYAIALAHGAIRELPLCGALSVLIGFGATLPAAAGPAPSYFDLLGEAEHVAPTLLEGRESVTAAEGLADQATAWPNPALGLEVEDFGGTGPYSGSSGQQTTLTVSEPIQLGRKRRARIGAGRAALDAARARQQITIAEFGYDLAIAYASAEAAQARVDLETEALRSARDDVRATHALVEAGKEAHLREAQALAAAAAAEADLEAARTDVTQAFASLSNLMGVSEPYTGVTPSLLTVADDLKAPEGPMPEEMPSVVVARAEREAAASRTAVERLRVVPDISVYLGVRRFSRSSDTAFMGGISVPVPLFDSNRGAIAAARAEQTAAEIRSKTARLQARTAWQTTLSQISASAAGLTAAKQAEEAAREAYRLGRIAYDSGRSPLIEVLSARRGLTEAQTRTLDARLARIRAEAALARLAGHTLLEEAQ
jgi:cobalt-zinc-cadmium efflux system outer membrane protein